MVEWIQIQQVIGAVVITAMVTTVLVTWTACLISGVLKKCKKKSHPLYVTEIVDCESEGKAADGRREKLIDDWKQGKI